MAGPLELNRAVPGGRVEMFAILDTSYPVGGSTASNTTTPKTAKCFATATLTTMKHLAPTTDTSPTARIPLSRSRVSVHGRLFVTEIARITEETPND